MVQSALLTTQKNNESPILIVDKKGEIGLRLSERLKNESVIVLVSSVMPEKLHENIIHIPFVKRYPTIPDNPYSHMVLIDEDLSISKNSLDKFLKKAKNDNSFVFLGVEREQLTEKLVLDTISNYENVKIGVFGDIFADKFIYSNNIINKQLSDINHFGRIIVPDDGTQRIFPVFLDDTVDAILEIFFGKKTDRITYIFSSAEITLLSIASIFKKLNPEIRIDFKKTKKKIKEHILLSGNFYFDDKYDLFEKLKRVEIPKDIEYRIKIPSKEKSNKLPFFITIFSFLIILVLLPFLSMLIFVFFGNISAQNLDKNILINDLNTSKKLSYFSLKSFNAADGMLGLLKTEISFLNISSRINNTESDLEVKSTRANAYYNLLSSVLMLSPILQNKEISQNSFSIAVLTLKNAIYHFNNQLLDGAKQNFIADFLNFSSATSDTWESILGFNRPKNYLLLISNSSTLEPSGGVINIFYLITIKDGKIVKSVPYNTSDSDTKLTTHVEPPFPIRRYLLNLNSSIKQSEFNIDFSKSAATSAMLLNSEEQKVVDGVISIDSFFIRSLLNFSGPIKLSDGTVLNSNNALSQIHNLPNNYLEKEVVQNMFSQIEGKKNLPTIALLQTLAKLAYEKHILFAFNDSSEQAAFSINGFSSSLIDDRQENENNINDFIGIIESNLGQNKVNFLISKNVTQKINVLENGDLSEQLIVKFRNNSKNKKEFYKNYFYLILPKDSEIESISINGKVQKISEAVKNPAIYEAKNYTPTDGIEVSSELQSDKLLIGFLLSLLPDSQSEVKLMYNIKSDKGVLPEFNYSNKVFKQPGIDSYPYSLFLNVSPNLKITSSSKNVRFTGENAQFSGLIKRDQDLQVNFSSK